MVLLRLGVSKETQEKEKEAKNDGQEMRVNGELPAWRTEGVVREREPGEEVSEVAQSLVVTMGRLCPTLGG